MIELAEEPYDGPAGRALVAELLAEVNVRYAVTLVGLTEDERAAGDAAYLAEVAAADLCRPTGCFVVARLDQQPVACGALKAYVPYDDTPAPEGVAEIKRMYTTPSARRLGLSRRILEHLERAAAELGYRELRLETGTPQPEAMGLYASAGWDPIAPYGHYRDSDLNRCFRKDVAPR